MRMRRVAFGEVLMRPTAILLLVPFVVACGAAAGATGLSQAQTIETNEALTVSHLRSLVGAQVQAQSLSIIDADSDGVGEYAFLGELSCAIKARGPGQGLKMPLLGGGFGQLSTTGLAEVHGYYYRSFLPGPDDVPVGEGPGASSDVDPDGAEEAWLCYAWPVEYGVTGRRTFVVGARQAVRGADLAAFTGRAGPDAGAAFVEGTGFVGELRPEWEELD
jgi:hypothetical protein